MIPKDLQDMLGDPNLPIFAPAWMYVINRGNEVAFGGASRLDRPHPWAFGSDRQHLFLTGGLVLRPYTAVATDAFTGYRLDQVMTWPLEDTESHKKHMTDNEKGEVIL